MSLQKKVALVVSAGLLVFMTIAGLVGIQALQRSTHRTLQERLAMAQLIAQGIDQLLGRALYSLRHYPLSETIDLEDGDLAPERRALLDLYHTGLFNHDVFLLDKYTTVLWQEPYLPEAVGYPFLDYYVTSVLATGEPTIYSSIDPQSNRALISLATPIRNKEGTIIGILGGRIESTHLTVAGLMRAGAIGRTGYADLVDENGTVIASTQPEHLLKKNDHWNYLLPLIQSKQPQVKTYPDVKESEPQHTDVVAFVPLAMTSWGITMEQHKAEALANVRDLQKQMVMVGIPALLISLALAWVGARSLVKPIRILITGCEKIAEGDLDAPVLPRGSGEIGTLARAFETMRTRLRASRSALEKANQELDDKVTERTQAIAEQTRELSVLNTVAQEVNQSLDLDRTLGNTLDRVLEALETNTGAILLYIDNGHIVLKACRGLGEDYIKSLAHLGTGSGLLGQLTPWEESNALEKHPTPETGSIKKGQYFVNVPLTSKGQTLGVMVITRHQERPCTPRELELLTAIGQQIGVAIDNAKLFQEARNREQEAEALGQIYVDISALLDTDRILNSVVESARHLLGTDVAAIALADDQGQTIFIKATSGPLSKAFKDIRLEAGQGIAGKVIAEGKVVMVEDYVNDSTIVHAVDAAVGENGLRAHLAAPLKIGDRVLGSLEVADRTAHPFSQRDAELLSRLADQAAVAIENATLYAQIERMAVLEERDRIAREIHDTLGQTVAYLGLKIISLKRLVASGQIEQIREELGEIENALRGATADVRDAILSLKMGISPNVGLVPTLTEYVERFGELAGLKTEITVTEGAPVKLAPMAEVQALRIIQEAFTNIRKHAQANKATLRLEAENGWLKLTAEDDGRGFESALMERHDGRHFGLQTMQERAQSVGGHLHIETAPGKGTKVIINLPNEVKDNVNGKNNNPLGR